MRVIPTLKPMATLFLSSTVLLRPATSLALQKSVISTSLRRGISGSFQRISSQLNHRSFATLPRVLHSICGDDGREELWYPPSLMDHMLYRIQEVNKVPNEVKRSLLDFVVDGKILGKVTSVHKEKTT